MLGAVGMLVFIGRRWQRRGRAHDLATAQAQPMSTAGGEYDARLDEELDRLEDS
jgi:hypothetical protein